MLNFNPFLRLMLSIFFLAEQDIYKYYICFHQMEVKADALLTIIEEIWQNTISSLPRKIKCHQNQITLPRVNPCSYLKV